MDINGCWQIQYNVHPQIFPTTNGSLSSHIISNICIPLILLEWCQSVLPDTIKGVAHFTTVFFTTELISLTENFHLPNQKSLILNWPPTLTKTIQKKCSKPNGGHLDNKEFQQNVHTLTWVGSKLYTYINIE